jgi:methylthioribose-1-phosphate isomerase
MQINDKTYRTIWLKDGDTTTVQIIDQRRLPHEWVIQDLKSFEDAAIAIKDMAVRGAPLIGVTAAYGLYLAALHGPKDRLEFDKYMEKVAQELLHTRPTAINLQWAIERQLNAMKHGLSPEAKTKISLEAANLIAEQDIEMCRLIGEHGLEIIREISKRKNGEAVQILTHCNAGWLGTVDWGTATAPIYNTYTCMGG